jgi:hypothetical protein
MLEFNWSLGLAGAGLMLGFIWIASGAWVELGQA